VGVKQLIAARPEVVIEAARTNAVRECAEDLLSSGIAWSSFPAAPCAMTTCARASSAPRRNTARSSTFPRADRGLDALKAACAAGVDEVSIAVTKPPAAGRGFLTSKG